VKIVNKLSLFQKKREESEKEVEEMEKDEVSPSESAYVDLDVVHTMLEGESDRIGDMWYACSSNSRTKIEIMLVKHLLDNDVVVPMWLMCYQIIWKKSLREGYCKML